jgi:hypothetical protein
LCYHYRWTAIASRKNQGSKEVHLDLSLGKLKANFLIGYLCIGTGTPAIARLAVMSDTIDCKTPGAWINASERFIPRIAFMALQDGIHRIISGKTKG